jgi:hypothetical protein
MGARAGLQEGNSERLGKGLAVGLREEVSEEFQKRLAA